MTIVRHAVIIGNHPCFGYYKENDGDCNICDVSNDCCERTTETE